MIEINQGVLSKVKEKINFDVFSLTIFTRLDSFRRIASKSLEKKKSTNRF